MRLRVRLVEVDIGGFDRQLAAVRHRIAGIDREIHDHLLELIGIGADPPEIGREHGDERNVLANEAAEHLVHLRDDAVEIEHLGLEHLPPAVGEQLAGQRSRPLGRLADLLDIASLGIARRQFPQQELRVAQDRRQEVIEVVGDAARELSDRFHLL